MKRLFLTFLGKSLFPSEDILLVWISKTVSLPDPQIHIDMCMFKGESYKGQMRDAPIQDQKWKEKLVFSHAIMPYSLIWVYIKGFERENCKI